jgi:hypothetical protein
VHFETTLNLAWVFLGLWALAATARAAFRRPAVTRPVSKCFHVVGVALIVSALFPYISATDDILRIDQFNSQHDRQHHPGKQNKSDDLIRLYETMDSPLVCRTSEVVLNLSFEWFVFAPILQDTERIAPFVAGRSPPSVVNA